MTDIPLKKYRVTRTGRGGFRITIPKVVADAWDLKAGDKLQMILRDGKELIIYRPNEDI